MRAVLRVVGVLMVVQGAGGIIDQLGGRPWFGLFLINRSGLFGGYETYANLVLAALGAGVIAAAGSVTGTGMK